VLVAGTVISLGAADTNSLLPVSVRPIPSWLAGPFANTGVALGWGGSMAIMAVMFAAYALVVRHAERLTAGKVLAAIVALHAVVLLAPPLLSTDIFSYVAYARMGDIYGANPYLHGPHAIMPDAIYPFIGAKWVNISSVYGPLFTMLSYFMAPLSIASAVLAFKGLAAAASLATVAIVFHSARLRGVNPVKAAALVGLNPLIILYGVGGGHNDFLMVALAIAGVSLLLQRRERAGGASLVLAAGVKLTAGLLLPFALAGASGPLCGRRRREVLIGAATTAAALAALAFAVFGAGSLHVIATVGQSQSQADWHTIPGIITHVLGLNVLGKIVGGMLAVAFAAVFVWLLRRVWQGRLDWIDGAAWATVALLITASSVLPWYVAWLLPLAALGRDPRLWRWAVALTGVITAMQLIGYLPPGTLGLGFGA
jgi:Glycosyltransferase family 87